MSSPPQLRICVLASGSSGNCIYVESPSTALLIDAGLSARETLRRLAAAGLDPAKLRAICVSHEHTDHVAGLVQLHKQLGVALYANGDTARGVKGGEAPVNASPAAAEHDEAAPEGAPS